MEKELPNHFTCYGVEITKSTCVFYDDQNYYCIENLTTIKRTKQIVLYIMKHDHSNFIIYSGEYNFNGLSEVSRDMLKNGFVIFTNNNSKKFLEVPKEEIPN